MATKPISKKQLKKVTTLLNQRGFDDMLELVKYDKTLRTAPIGPSVRMAKDLVNRIWKHAQQSAEQQGVELKEVQFALIKPLTFEGITNEAISVTYWGGQELTFIAPAFGSVSQGPIDHVIHQVAKEHLGEEIASKLDTYSRVFAIKSDQWRALMHNHWYQLTEGIMRTVNAW